MSLQEFEQKYNNQKVDYDGSFGSQCVDLMNRYMVDVLGITNPIQTLPGETAYEIFQQANSPLFTKIPNTPTGVPAPGDIVFFDTSVGSAGHVCIFLRGDVTTFTSLDQNYPTGSPVHEQLHNYNGVAGWLHFNQLASTIYKGLDLTNTDSVKVAIDMWDAVVNQGLYIKKDQYETIETQLSAASDHSKTVQEQLDAETKNRNTLQSDFSSLKSKYDEDERAIVDLKGQLVKVHQEDLDYAAKAMDAEKLADDRMNYLNAIFNEAGVSRNTTDEKQLVEETLNEIAQLRKNQPEGTGDYTPEKTLTIWEEHFKEIIDYAIEKGLNEYLKLNNLQIVDLDGNPQDETVSEKFKNFFNDKMSRLDFLEQAQQSVGVQFAKARPFLVNLGDSIYDFFAKIDIVVPRESR